MSKKILIITGFYWPKIHVASNRAHAFVKYFKRSGYEVEVLTVCSSGFSNTYTQDDQLVTDKIDEVLVHRIQQKHLLNRADFDKSTGFAGHKIKVIKNKILNYFIADDMPGFYLNFKRFEIIKRIDFSRFDYVLSSFAPLSCHLIAKDLKKEYPKLKWIADFRDEMSQLPLSKYLKKNLEVHEKQIVNAADIVTTISKTLLRQFESVAKNPICTSFLEVRNGFDFDLIKDPEDRQEFFKIIYMGTFYGARNPNLFFDALKIFVQVYPDQPLQFDIYGGSPNTIIPMELLSKVKIHEKINYNQVPNRLKESSCSLLIEPSIGRVGGYTGKLFDYLAVNRPILAYIKSGDLAEQLIIECNAGYVSDYKKPEDVFKLLEKLYLDWKNDRLPKKNWDVVRQQSREFQIEKLIVFLKEHDLLTREALPGVKEFV